jgi:peroxiredoxin (alkyl hydroperoxide reductase subunit C)
MLPKETRDRSRGRLVPGQPISRPVTSVKLSVQVNGSCASAQAISPSLSDEIVGRQKMPMQALGVEVFSVSVDSVFVHKMWNDHELSKMVDGGVPFHMVSDAAGNVGKVFGVYNENLGVELRGRFIIDPDGVIQAMEVLTPPVGRRFAETIRQIQAFQLVRASKGTITPLRLDAGPTHPLTWAGRVP